MNVGTGSRTPLHGKNVISPGRLTARVPHSMPGEKRELAVLVRERGLHISRGEPFTLASGRKSTYFVDMKPICLDPRGSVLISSLLLGTLTDLGIEQVGGMESGAIPLVACVVHASAAGRHPICGFYVRKSAKPRGTMRAIEGNVIPGARTAILEDVTTTGGMSLRAAASARDAGCMVEHVVTVLDRGEGASSTLKAEGLRLVPLLELRDILPEGVPGG